MGRLSEHQLNTLRQAAAREDGVISDAGVELTTANSLIRRGLMLSLPTEQGRSLLITAEGRQALGEHKLITAAPSSATAQAEAPPEQPKGKLGELVALLSRSQGASLQEMQDVTGWQAHSVRGALAGALKKKLKLSITSIKADGVRTYRIEEMQA